jgi:hypothetical protein
MLVDTINTDTAVYGDPLSRMIAEVNGNRFVVARLKQGVYQIPTFSGECFIAWPYRVERYPTFNSEGNGEYRGAYGVCDSADQILSLYPELTESDRCFTVTLCEVRREAQSESGGWRWHKWGRYIGTFEPQHEYLDDEVGIDRVFCYHIYELVS